MIYLASPYTDERVTVMERRFRQAFAVVGKMTAEGKVVYSPIVYYHPIAETYALPRNFNFWKNLNFAMLNKADLLYVLQLEGWEASIGMREEVLYAQDRGIPVEYIKPSNWL